MSGKRSLQPRVRVYWSRTEKDLMVNWDEGCSTPSANYIISLFPKHVTEELESRGYDLSTIRFQIRKKPITEGQ